MAKRKKSKIGIRLTQLREATGLSQRDLADKARVNHNTVAKIESGERGHRPSLGVVMKLAAALGVPLEGLIT